MKSKILAKFPIFGPVMGLLLVILLFSQTRGFLTPNNVSIILTQTVIVTIAALGMTKIIVSGGIDLSVGAVVAFTSVLGAYAVLEGLTIPLVFLLAIIGGGVFGLINGGIIAGFKMNPFIVTLGMMGVARGASKWLGKNQTVNYDPGSSINYLMNNPAQFGGYEIPLWVPPIGVVVALLMAAFISIVMNKTVFGRHIYAIGSNEATARLCGIRTELTKLRVYFFAGLLYGLAGIMQLSRLQQGDPTVAMGLELDVIAAVVIGGASLSGGTGSVFGAVIGALIMATLRNGSDQIGWPNYVQEIIIGLVIVFAVGLDRLRQRQFNL